jgi:tagaturonate epimerase
MSNAGSTAELRSVRNVLPQSIASTDKAEFGMTRVDGVMHVVVLAPAGAPVLKAFEGELTEQAGKTLLTGPTNARNAAALRAQLEWLKPHPLGLSTSAGTGDRLGLATPGHVRAFRAVGGKLAPIFAQQSIREMTRTGRSPQQVMDDAMWGVFAEGWREGVGADADHLKSTHDIDACVAAGFTFFTIDPGDHVDNSAEDASLTTLQAAVEKLPWDRLEDSAADLRKRYLGQTFDVEGNCIEFDEHTLLRASAKYGRAIAHVTAMYRHLIQVTGGKNCELEVSVDETETPTTHAEHVFIAKELQRLGVKWVSLAPRYIGRFEKGVDYIGDVGAFESDFQIHAAIARCFGPYKLSLHSGSDKFSIYGPAMHQTRGLVHLKTAGTSYLEALHTVAAIDPDLFCTIYAFARDRYETDRASYHVSASLDRAPLPNVVCDGDLPGLLDQFDAREIFHVTFGSVLTAKTADGKYRFYDRLMHLLMTHPEEYAANLQKHFERHLRPFVS